MEKKYNNRKSADSFSDETSDAGIIDNLKLQLNAIEKKLDILISQNEKRPSRNFDNHQSNDRQRKDSSFGERTYTLAICSLCKKECKLPFKPTGSRAVFCSDCFSKNNQNNKKSDNSFEKREFSSDRRPDKRTVDKKQKIWKKKNSFSLGRKKRA